MARADQVLVTGGAGYVGSCLVTSLLRGGRRVTVVDSLLYGGESLHGHLGDPNFRLVRGDIRDARLMALEIDAAEAVVHLAALVGDKACNVAPDITYDVNFTATKFLIERARQAQKRTVFASTCSNYGKTDTDDGVDEDAPLQPLALYASTKVDAEAAGLAAGASVLRLATIAGLAPRTRLDVLLNNIARDAALGLPITIYGPDGWRPFTHVADAARAVELCLDAPAAIVEGSVFNIVGCNLRKRDLGPMILARFPKAQVTIQEGDTDPRSYRVSGDRARAMLGFVPSRDCEAALDEVASAITTGQIRDPTGYRYESAPQPADLAIRFTDNGVT